MARSPLASSILLPPPPGGGGPTSSPREDAAIAQLRSEEERQRLSARLPVADRMVSVGTLAGGVAHELNNPLSYVTANLAFISKEVAKLGHRLQAAGVGDPSLAETAAELVEAAADARDGVEKLRGLVRDLQTLSRRDDSVLAPLDLTHVLESAIRVARSETKHRAIVERQLAASLPPVRANEARLGQVFLNLLVNAAHAIPAGQPSANVILVRSYVAPGWRVAVEVTDTGCGIPDEQLERILDPFHGTEAPGTGTGPWLPICRSIVSALGGELEVESRVGVGSTFRVLLPVVPAERPQEPDRPAPAPAPATKARLLVVDDEPLVGAVLQRTLGDDFDLTCVGGSGEALALLEGGQRYDLILSDLSMPGMTGMELHGAVAQLSPAQAGRMIFLSGGAFTAAARDFLDRPGMEYLGKPFELDALRAVIDRRLAQG